LLKIPRKQMLCRLSDAERLTAIALDGKSAMGALAGAVIQGAANVNADLEPCAASKLAASVIDIFAASIETEFRGVKGMPERHGDILERAKNYIQANLGDSELDVEMVSNAIGVSRRTLNRIFAAHGTTAARWLWQKRLEASHTTLTEGRSQHIADVAIACGFSDFSHFSRAFKKTYGIAPNTLVKRRAA
jgi:transcriptional regulator GlxA family with amidase domain